MKYMYFKWGFIFVVYQEKLLLDAMFEVPGTDIVGVQVTEDAVNGKEGVIYIREGDSASDSHAQSEAISSQARA